LKAERDKVAERTDRLALPRRADRLRGIFDHAQFVFVGDRIQRVHIHRLARQVHRDNRAGLRSNCRLNLVQVDVACDRVYVGKHRRCADFDDTLGVATHEIGVVMTSSPGPMPAMRKAISIVHVPELKVRTGRPPKNADSCFSNFLHLWAAGNPAGNAARRYRGDSGFVYGRPGERKKIAHKYLIQATEVTENTEG